MTPEENLIKIGLLINDAERSLNAVKEGLSRYLPDTLTSRQVHNFLCNAETSPTTNPDFVFRADKTDGTYEAEEFSSVSTQHDRQLDTILEKSESCSKTKSIVLISSNIENLVNDKATLAQTKHSKCRPKNPCNDPIYKHFDPEIISCKKKQEKSTVSNEKIKTGTSNDYSTGTSIGSIELDEISSEESTEAVHASDSSKSLKEIKMHHSASQQLIHSRVDLLGEINKYVNPKSTSDIKMSRSRTLGFSLVELHPVSSSSQKRGDPDNEVRSNILKEHDKYPNFESSQNVTTEKSSHNKTNTKPLVNDKKNDRKQPKIAKDLEIDLAHGEYSILEASINKPKKKKFKCPCKKAKTGYLGANPNLIDEKIIYLGEMPERKVSAENKYIKDISSVNANDSFDPPNQSCKGIIDDAKCTKSILLEGKNSHCSLSDLSSTEEVNKTASEPPISCINPIYANPLNQETSDPGKNESTPVASIRDGLDDTITPQKGVPNNTCQVTPKVSYKYNVIEERNVQPHGDLMNQNEIIEESNITKILEDVKAKLLQDPDMEDALYTTEYENVTKPKTIETKIPTKRSLVIQSMPRIDIPKKLVLQKILGVEITETEAELNKPVLPNTNTSYIKIKHPQALTEGTSSSGKKINYPSQPTVDKKEVISTFLNRVSEITTTIEADVQNLLSKTSDANEYTVMRDNFTQTHEEHNVYEFKKMHPKVSIDNSHLTNTRSTHQLDLINDTGFDLYGKETFGSLKGVKSELLPKYKVHPFNESCLKLHSPLITLYPETPKKNIKQDNIFHVEVTYDLEENYSSCDISTKSSTDAKSEETNHSEVVIKQEVSQNLEEKANICISLVEQIKHLEPNKLTTYPRTSNCNDTCKLVEDLNYEPVLKSKQLEEVEELQIETSPQPINVLEEPVKYITARCRSPQTKTNKKLTGGNKKASNINDSKFNVICNEKDETKQLQWKLNKFNSNTLKSLNSPEGVDSIISKYSSFDQKIKNMEPETIAGLSETFKKLELTKHKLSAKSDDEKNNTKYSNENRKITSTINKPHRDSFLMQLAEMRGKEKSTSRKDVLTNILNSLPVEDLNFQDYMRQPVSNILRRGYCRGDTSSECDEFSPRLDDTLSDGEIQCACSVSSGELHHCNSIKSTVNFLKSCPDKLMSLELGEKSLKVRRKHKFNNNLVAYYVSKTSESESLIKSPSRAGTSSYQSNS